MENDRQEESFLESLIVDDEEQYLNSLPPGYRFRPTDEELLTYYLKIKLLNERLPPNKIKEENIYNSSPHHLSDKYDEQREGIMYFFTPRDRKYPNGSRPRRDAGNGFWKASGKAEEVNGQDGISIGYKRTLVYYQGKPKDAIKTNWLMNEFTLHNQGASTTIRGSLDDMKLDKWVLCKIYKRSPKKDQGENRKVASVNSATVSETSESTLAELPTTYAMCSTSSSQMPGRQSHAMCSTSSFQMPVYNSGHSQMPAYNNGYSHAMYSSSQTPIYNNGHSHTICNPRSSQMLVYNNSQNTGQNEIGFPVQQGHVVSPVMHSSNYHTQPNQGSVDPRLSLLEENNMTNGFQGINMANDYYEFPFSDFLLPEDFSSGDNK